MLPQLSHFNAEQQAAIKKLQPPCWKAMEPATAKYHEVIYQAHGTKDGPEKEATKEQARQTFMDETDEIIKPYLAQLGETGLFTEEELTRIPF